MKDFVIKNLVCLLFCVATVLARASGTPEQWRAEKRLIDMHQHIEYTTQRLARAVGIMDAVGIGVAVNLSGGTVSQLERNKALADRLHPGRFLHYFNLDYKGWDEPDFAERAAKQVAEAARLGAAGLKEFKRLGLNLRDGNGQLIKIDDPKLDGAWRKCGELGLPVSIHVADPRAFWLPFDEKNERWKELRDHKPWWFGDSNKYPPRMELLNALNRVIERHPKTTFVCVHFANNAEELEWVDASLSKYSNMMADLAARVPEIGRHDPEKVRALFIKHQDRIVFGTDFQVLNRLILGSSGNEPPPSDDDARVFFEKYWRWLETRDKDWPHMTPIQGDWTISSIGLPKDVLHKIYFGNARKLLARSLPLPAIRAARIEEDFELDGKLTNAVWKQASSGGGWIDAQSRDCAARPRVATRVKLLWSDNNLYLGYECPFEKLSTFEPPQFDKERLGLWDRDVVEAFIESTPGEYTEFEVAPTNEKLDLILFGEKRDFEWSSGFQSAVQVDDATKVWTCEMKIPLKALAKTKPQPGTRWRINLYRCDKSQNAYMAWSPTLTGTFHTPGRFGVLEFE